MLKIEYNRLEKEDTEDIFQLKEECIILKTELQKREKEFEKEKEKLKLELTIFQEKSHNQISKAKTAKSSAESKHAELVLYSQTLNFKPHTVYVKDRGLHSHKY